MARYEPKEIDVDSLPELTPKQQAFVEAYLENGFNASAAYRAAYDCDNMGSASIQVAASRVKHNANVAIWLSMAIRAGAGKAGFTAEQYMLEVRALGQKAEDSGDFTTALKALNTIGDVSGHHRQEIVVRHENPANLLQQIARIDPRIAEQIAQKYALPMPGKVIEHEAER